MIKKNKKTMKVKKKKVIYAKKKVVKKTTKKKTIVKRKKYKKRKKITMEDIYVIINKVQMNRKEVNFTTNLIDSFTIENTIKDTGLTYKRIEQKTQVDFIIYPNEETYDKGNDMVNIDEIDDEIPDVGQIFG